MIPMFSLRSFTNNSQVIQAYIDKLDNNQLTIEDILKEEDVVNSMKKNSSSQFFSIFSNEIIRKLIDFATTMPQYQDLDRGYKYPYFSCEILCSDSDAVLDLFVQKRDIEIENSDDNSEESDEEDEEKSNDNIEEKKEAEEKAKEDRAEEDENENVQDKEKLTNGIEDGEKNKDEILISKEKKKVTSVIEDNNEEDPFIVYNMNTVGETQENNIIKIETNIRENQIDQIIEKVNGISLEDQKEEQESKNEDNQNKEEEVQDEDEKQNQLLSKPKKIKKTKEFKTVYENLDYFFKYLLANPEETNHVLTGYFYKILSSLLERKGDMIMNYLFETRIDIIDNLVKHSNLKLIGECISRILTYSSGMIDSLESKKVILLEKLIQELQETKDEEAYEFICATLITCQSSRPFFQLLMTQKELLNLLFSILYKNINLQYILPLMIKINESLLKAFNNLVTPDRTNEGIPEQMNINYIDSNIDDDKRYTYMFGETKEENDNKLQLSLGHLFNFLKESSFIMFVDLNKYDLPEFEITTYDGTQMVLGMKKLAQVEYFRTILDIIINCCAKEYLLSEIEVLIQMMLDVNVFKNLIDIFFKFEFNNMFQILFMHIMTIVLNEHCPKSIIDHIFKELALIEKLQDHLINKRLFSMGSSKTINSCLFAFEITLFNDISMSLNKHLRELIQDTDFPIFQEIYINDLNGLFKGKLCYTEDNNSYPNNTFNSQSNVSQSKSIDKSLNEIIEGNMAIYEVYKQNGDYKELLEEKQRNEEFMRNQNKNMSVDLNISDDVNAYNRNRDEEEEIPDRDVRRNELFSSNNFEANEEEDKWEEVNEEDQREEEEKENYYYSDNNYWSPNSDQSNDIDDIIHELLR